MANDAMAVFDKITTLEHEYFRVQFAPVGPPWLSDELLSAIAQRSAESNRRVHMHLLESSWQHEWADGQNYEGGFMGHLDRLGLLSPRLAVAHGVHLTEDDYTLLAERQVTVSVTA